MLLRGSGEQDGASLALDAVIDGGEVDGVAHASVLLRFAESIVLRNGVRTARARADVIDQMDAESMADAAAVAANFERMVRIADATGITLGERLAEPTAQVRAELGLDRFAG